MSLYLKVWVDPLGVAQMGSDFKGSPAFVRNPDAGFFGFLVRFAVNDQQGRRLAGNLLAAMG